MNANHTPSISTPNPILRAFGAFAAFLQGAASADRGEALSDSASVRRFADRVRATDRGFSDDLYAAADRHDMEAEQAERLGSR